MPEMTTYVKLAVEYGGVDPNDAKAIDLFYEEGLTALPEATQLAIVEKLIGEE